MHSQVLGGFYSDCKSGLPGVPGMTTSISCGGRVVDAGCGADRTILWACIDVADDYNHQD